MFGTTFVLNCEFSYLKSIHTAGRLFDWTSEVKVVVAKMIGRCFNLVFGQSASIENYIEVNWLSSSHSSFVRDQEEIENPITLVFN